MLWLFFVFFFQLPQFTRALRVWVTQGILSDSLNWQVKNRNRTHFMASVHAHIHMQCHMQSITHGCNYLISITTCQQALYQLSAQSICNHIPHSIPLEGCLDQVLGWLCLPESKKNEMLPTFLNYEAVCASLLYIGSRGEKRSKSGYKNIWSKEQQ